jgi:hypothetical protein
MDPASLTGLITAATGLLSYLQLSKDKPLKDSLKNAVIPPDEEPVAAAGLTSSLHKTSGVSSLPPQSQIAEIRSARLTDTQVRTPQEFVDYYKAEASALRDNYNNFMVAKTVPR